ncbi:MAG TPA: CDP-glycerol glycerophosphotransferase family protein [Candidatus Saccharimonadales bacterium]|nr:CDP-glycerol glycerophosphotransferase family protein [Candidatus Saccharimonadales bacterium]
MRPIKAPLIYLAKKYPFFKAARHFYLNVHNRLGQRLYTFVKLEPTTVIFESYNGRSYSDSPRAIYEQMLTDKRFADFKFVWAFRNPAKYHEVLDRPNTRLVRYRSVAYFIAYAKAKYWVTNSMIPLEVGKKPSQILLQTWHGTPLKRLRNDIVEDTKNAMNTVADFKRKNDTDTVRYDYLVSPSRFASEAFSSAFDLKRLGKQDILIETGYPRNDYLFKLKESDVQSIKRQLGLPENKKVLLYAPTWRDDQHSAAHGYVYKNPTNFDYLKERLGDDWVILFRAHYMVANAFDFNKYRGFVYNVSDLDEVNQLYAVADVLMTDYSSVFFDYANLDRPILFYMYDPEHYKDELRGFYFDIKELPGDIVRTEAEIVKDLQDLEAYRKRFAKKFKAFNEKFNYLDDAGASQRVIDRVFNGRI